MTSRNTGVPQGIPIARHDDDCYLCKRHPATHRMSKRNEYMEIVMYVCVDCAIYTQQTRDGYTIRSA